MAVPLTVPDTGFQYTGWQTPLKYMSPAAGQACCAIAALDVPAARTTAIAKTFNLVGIATSLHETCKRATLRPPPIGLK